MTRFSEEKRAQNVWYVGLCLIRVKAFASVFSCVKKNGPWNFVFWLLAACVSRKEALSLKRIWSKKRCRLLLLRETAHVVSCVIVSFCFGL